MLIGLVCIPVIAALAAFAAPWPVLRRLILAAVALLELILAVVCWFRPPSPVFGGILFMDGLGLMVLTVICTLFLAAATYALTYLRNEDANPHSDFIQGQRFQNAPEAIFCACLLLFLAAAVLVTMTRHFGLLWIAIEATTLASAPLIYFHKHKRSLEATWKYLMICSVGIALALLGNILLDVSMQTVKHMHVDMTVDALILNKAAVHLGWFKASFVFLLIGYATKMGIAPMHTWLPDAHSESPSLVSALLSGALLNCAFLGICRAHELSRAVGLGDFSSQLLLFFGLFSMLVATVFIVGQSDFKRMLAYSSVEHMGILLLALGIGGAAVRGGLLHMVGHSLSKAALFLLAGNILAKYGTKSIHDIRGLAKVLPMTGILWMAGLIALVGSPPFALFISEFSVIMGILDRGWYWMAALVLFFLGVIFVGMILPAVSMCSGPAPAGMKPERTEQPLLILPSAILLAFVLVLGLYLPGWFSAALDRAAAIFTTLGGL